MPAAPSRAVEVTGLAARAARCVGAPEAPAAALARALLALPQEGAGAAPAWRTRSGLNNDGSPIEVCFSSLPDGVRARLVCDPAAHLFDPVARHRAGLAALERALDLTAAQPLAPLCRQTLEALLPADDAGLADYLEGVLWLGAGLGFPGLALYVDLSRGPLPARFERARGWLAGLLPDPSAALAVLARLDGVARLQSAGVEGLAPANARAKLFFRLERPLALADLGIEALAHPRFLEFLATVMGEREIALKGLVFSLSFTVADGRLFEAKVDVCGHCLARPAAAWEDLLAAVAGGAGSTGSTGGASSVGLPVPPAAGLLAEEVAEVAYLGLARNLLGQERLDLFLKPPAPARLAPEPAPAGRFHG